MAKDFNKAGSAKTFGEVASKSAAKATVTTVKYIDVANLVDNPKNDEDISDTADLELSMRENGFLTPLDVVAIDGEDGKYMIVSGHRRRAAYVKVGTSNDTGRVKEYPLIPCIVRQFESEAEVRNFLLLANSQRDSSKNPLLMPQRYRNNVAYLEETGFKGSIANEAARRLGYSYQQAARFDAMNRMIPAIWDMVRDGEAGVSSVYPIATFTPEEQAEIVEIMRDAQKKNVSLTRETVKMITDAYKNGKKTWAEIANLPRDSGMPMNAFMNTEPSESRDNSESGDRNGEVRREFDPIAAEADRADADRAEWEHQQQEQDAGDAGDDGEDGGEKEKQPKEKKPPLSDEEQAEKNGEDIGKMLTKLDTLISEVYSFTDNDKAEEVMKHMGAVVCALTDEIYTISRDNGKEDVYKELLADIKSNIGGV